MGEENKSALEQYAEIKLREEQAKSFNNSIKSLTMLAIIILIVIGLIYNWIEGMFLNANTTKSILEDTFTTSSISNPIKYSLAHDNGYMLIRIYSDSRENALQNLRKSYLEMSKKQVSNNLNTLSIVIYEFNEKIMFNSNITIDEIMKNDWENISTYVEFMKMANIQ